MGITIWCEKITDWFAQAEEKLSFLELKKITGETRNKEL